LGFLFLLGAKTDRGPLLNVLRRSRVNDAIRNREN